RFSRDWSSDVFSSDLTGNPLVALWMRSFGTVAVDRENVSAARSVLEAAVDVLKAGELFGIYPEGTRSPDGRLYRGKIGVAWLARSEERRVGEAWRARW